ncbi:hypothetical protein BD414DRAFT_485960 [Trametes punicea]|nr:hypothetical protein BD414DRAFT_485960 [Trametes punicea]
MMNLLGPIAHSAGLSPAPSDLNLSSSRTSPMDRRREGWSVRGCAGLVLPRRPVGCNASVRTAKTSITNEERSHVGELQSSQYA